MSQYGRKMGYDQRPQISTSVKISKEAWDKFKKINNENFKIRIEKSEFNSSISHLLGDLIEYFISDKTLQKDLQSVFLKKKAEEYGIRREMRLKKIGSFDQIEELKWL